MGAAFSPELLLALTPSVLDLLFSTFGRADARGPKTATPLDLARALFTSGAPPKLARALLFVARFSTPAGRAALVEAARAIGDRRADAWLTEPPADVAAKLAVERATAKGRAKRSAERIAELAQLRMERELPERPTYELLAKLPVSPDKSFASALARKLRDVALDAWSHVDPDGTLRVALFVRLPAITRFVLGRGGRVTPQTDANVAVDLITVSPDGARVAVRAAIPELLPRYVDALGLSLRPSFTLKPLHDLSPESLARVTLPRGVRAIVVVATRWRTPYGARVEARARDVLSAGELHGAARAGYVDRATLRVDLGDRTVDAFLQLPHRVEIADPSREVELRAALAALGLFDPGALPDDARSLAPYTHPDWRWRSVVGDAGFDALVRAGLLTRVEVAHVATEELRMHGTSYVVRAVPGAKGAEYALAEDRAYGARLVEPDARVAWRLDLVALAAAMRADLGASKVDKASAVAIDGVLDAGLVSLASGKLRFLYAMGAPPRGWLETARRACGIGTTLVVLAPRGHAQGMDGVLVVELDVEEQLGVKRVGRALGRAAEALGVGGEVEAWRTCGEDVVIEVATQRVWICGVLVTLGEASYRLLELLAKSGGRVVATKELGAQLSARSSPEEGARKAKMRLETQVSEQLARAGVVWNAREIVVAEGKKGYRLGVSVRVV
jgi:hypothetical protein